MPATLKDYILVNPYVTFPDDFLPVIPYTMFFAVMHWILNERLITPLAKKYLVEDVLAKERREAALKAAAEPAAKGTRDASTAATGTSTNVSSSVTLRRSTRTKTAANNNASAKRNENGIVLTTKSATSRRRSGDDNGGSNPPKILAEKFHISVWNFFCNSLLWLYSWYAISSEPWASDPEQWFAGWPQSQTMTPRLFRLYYLFTGYYVYSSFHLFTELRQKDFPIIVIHHCISFFLVAFAILFGFQRVGAMLMFYHQASDPIMEFGKVFLYMGYQRVTDVCFVIFACVFIITRIIQYPLYCIWPAWKYPPTHYPDGTPDPGIFPLVMIALFTLLALHIFWSAIIVSMVIKALRDGLIKGDLRDPHFDEVAIEEVEHSAT